MKCLIQTFACLGLAIGSLSQPALAQAQDDAADAAPDLGPVLERLDQVIAGLTKLSGDLAKLQKANAKNQSLKTATKQLTDLNTAVGSLASQLAGQASRPASQPKWEYKSIFGDSRVALEEEMNLFGGDGWNFSTSPPLGVAPPLLLAGPSSKRHPPGQSIIDPPDLKPFNTRFSKYARICTRN